MLVYPTGIPTGGTGYTIENAIMLDGGADYLVRDPSSAGNRKTFTFSCWLKRSDLGSAGGTTGGNIFGGDRTSVYSDRIQFGSGDSGDDWLETSYHDGSSGLVKTKALYRDPTAWMHIVWVVDTAQSTDTNRVKVYVNGSLVTFNSPSYPAQDYDTAINNTENQVIGARPGNLAQQHFGGYLAEVILLDGTAVSDASSFGKLDSNGVWVPVDPSGLDFSGTNSFHLDFKVAPGTGNGAGTDVSGNNNHFTDVSLTTTQQVTDTCTDDADNDIGNHCTLNSLDPLSHTLSEGNLKVTAGATGRVNHGTIAIPTTGKWYWEAKVVSQSPNQGAVGIKLLSSIVSTNTDFSLGSGGYGMFQANNSGLNGHYFENSGTTVPGGGASQNITWAVNDIVNIAYSADDGKIWFGKNNTYYSNFTNGTSTTVGGSSNFGSIPSGVYVPAVAGTNGGGASAYLFNFGANAFSYTPPTGYKAINTANLPAPTVKNPDDGFVFITLEDGDTIEASLANARTGWSSFIDVFKREDTNNEDYDVRFSDDSGNSMHFNTNAAAGSEATLASGVNYSAWSWRVGATYGCYTAEISHTNGATTNQAHGLGSGAKSAVAKRSDSTGDWYVSHPNMSSANIRFNVQDRPSTSELVTVDGTNITLNSSFATGTYRVIVWEQIEGFSAFTNYSHNGSTTDGPYIHLGGSASLVAWRNIDSSNSNDFFATFPTYSTNGNGNPTDIRYNWNNGEKGYDGITIGDVTANGYKMRPSSGGAFGTGTDDPMLVWAWGLRPFGGDGVAQARSR